MKYFLAMCSAVLCAVLIAGCASSPKVADPSGVDISVVKLSSDQALMSFGSSIKEPNPYRMPGGLLSGRPHELVVLRFTVVASRKAQVFINQITALDADGNSVAQYKVLEDYAAYIGGWQSALTVQNVQIVRDTYLPGDSFEVRPGHHTYYAVLIGKNPIPRPFQVKVDAFVDEGESRIFTFDVTK